MGFLVFIHEGGHYLAARAFGVRVTEFMLGLPWSQHWLHEMGHEVRRHAVSAGGYAKVWMEPGEMSPHLEPVLAALYRRGTANMEDIARDCGITDDEGVRGARRARRMGQHRRPPSKTSTTRTAPPWSSRARSR
ncbi:MAG: site-2 protease family protein [Eggerthella lenta]